MVFIFLDRPIFFPVRIHKSIHKPDNEICNTTLLDYSGEHNFPTIYSKYFEIMIYDQQTCKFFTNVVTAVTPISLVTDWC